MKFCIDPGHGGYDPGAVGPTGLKEKDVTLAVSKLLVQRLRAAGQGVILTREGDAGDSDLWKRCQIANDYGTDVFISIHANAAANPAGKGMEIYTTKGQTDADPIAESIADSMIAAFPGMVFRADLSDGDKDKEANFYVLVNTTAPAVLVELAFISNPTEESLLRSPDYQDKAADAIFQGLAKMYGLTGQETAVDQVAAAIGVLQQVGVMASPDYWLENARPGKVCKGEYVGMLIQNMAKRVSGR
jgi:N-acetylmuramoyl-L-alanine amidase